jgi:hypothetical protein
MRRRGDRAFTDLFDRRLDLTLERRRGTLTAFAVPENSRTGFLLRTRIELDRKCHGRALPGEDACARCGPRHCAYFAALDLLEPALGLLDPRALDLAGRVIADAVKQTEGELGTVLCGQLEGLVQEA